MKKHTVYKTTCLKTNKFYIGVHSTINPNDSYLGSGKDLKTSVEKYGVDNHKKEIIMICETSKKAYEMEKLYVESNIGDPLCLNKMAGGYGGWDHTWNDPKRKKNAATALKDNNGFKNKTHSPSARKKIGKAKELDKSKRDLRIAQYKADDKSKGKWDRMSKLWEISPQACGRWVRDQGFNWKNDRLHGNLRDI